MTHQLLHELPPTAPCSRRERIEQLEELLERKRNLLTLAAELADGGKRVRSQIAELEQELAEACRAAGSGAAASSVARSSNVSAVAAATAHAPPVLPSVPAAATGAASGLPARPVGGSGSLLAAAASAPLPSGKLAAPVAAPAVPQAAPKAAHTAAPTADSAAPAAPAEAALKPAAPAAPSSKPAASPLFTRMRDMLWGSGSKQQAATVHSTGASHAAGTEKAWPVASGSHPAAPRSNAADSAGTKAMPQQGEQRQQQEVPAPAPPMQRAAPQGGQATRTAPPAPPQAAPPKAPCSHKEVKAKLLETLREIKRLEGGGMFDRHRVEKLRRRAARLAAQYEAGKDVEQAATGNSAS